VLVIPILFESPLSIFAPSSGLAHLQSASVRSKRLRFYAVGGSALSGGTDFLCFA